MTLHQKIQQVREALERLPFVWLTVQSNGKQKVGTIEYGENEKYYSETDVYNILAALPEPMSEGEVVKILDGVWNIDAEKHNVAIIRALREAGVLFCKEGE